jgi:hypothetical protein
MEMYYFSLGILSIISLIFCSLIVWGLVKVIKTKNDLENFKESYKWDLECNHRRFDDNKREVNLHMEAFNRNIEETINSVHRSIDENFNESRSYTDKRIDKFLNKSIDSEKN